MRDQRPPPPLRPPLDPTRLRTRQPCPQHLTLPACNPLGHTPLSVLVPRVLSEGDDVRTVSVLVAIGQHHSNMADPTHGLRPCNAERAPSSPEDGARSRR